MMQENFDDENHRSLNYTKIDRCQDNNSIDNDEYYRQIFYSNEYLHTKQKIRFKINLTNHLPLFLFMFLFLTSQSNALPIYQSGSLAYIQQPPPSGLPVAMVGLTDRSPYSPQSFNVYRRFPTPTQQQQVNRIPSYSNGAVVQIYDQQQSSAIVQNHQLKRERQRRAMIEKIVTIFDEDGRFNFILLKNLFTLIL